LSPKTSIIFDRETSVKHGFVVFHATSLRPFPESYPGTEKSPEESRLLLLVSEPLLEIPSIEERLLGFPDPNPEMMLSEEDPCRLDLAEEVRSCRSSLLLEEALLPVLEAVELLLPLDRRFLEERCDEIEGFDTFFFNSHSSTVITSSMFVLLCLLQKKRS
jgi:hypothetical protein